MLWEMTNEEFTNMFGISKNTSCEVWEEVIFDMMWWWDIWCKIYDTQWLFVDDIKKAWGKSSYRLMEACMRLDIFYQGRKVAKYNSIVCISTFLEEPNSISCMLGQWALLAHICIWSTNS